MQKTEENNGKIFYTEYSYKSGAIQKNYMSSRH